MQGSWDRGVSPESAATDHAAYLGAPLLRVLSLDDRVELRELSLDDRVEPVRVSSRSSMTSSGTAAAELPRAASQQPVVSQWHQKAPDACQCSPALGRQLLLHLPISGMGE